MQNESQPVDKFGDMPLNVPSAEEEDIAQLLEQGFLRLRFPALLEKRFRIFYLQRAIGTIKFASFYTVVFTMLVGGAGYLFLDESAIRLWGVGYLGVVVGLSSVVILVNQPALERYQQVFTSLFAGIALSSLMGTLLFIEDNELMQFASYQVMYVSFVIYTIARLRFFAAILTNLSGGIVTFLLSVTLDREIDWMHFNLYYVIPNIICGLVNYLLEHNDRTVFLQSRLLELEKTRLNSLSKQLTVLSREDGLTKLANRRHFDEVFEYEWNRCRRDRTPLSLLFIDVDFFKHYNDYYGHMAGDDCLAKVAATLAAQAFRTSDLVARYGGEEFVMLCPKTDLESARMIGERIVKEVDQLGIEHSPSLVSDHVTVSIGLACVIPAADVEPEDLIQKADMAVYKAKGSGRHCVVAEELLHP